MAQDQNLIHTAEGVIGFSMDDRDDGSNNDAVEYGHNGLGAGALSEVISTPAL